MAKLGIAPADAKSLSGAGIGLGKLGPVLDWCDVSTAVELTELGGTIVEIESLAGAAVDPQRSVSWLRRGAGFADLPVLCAHSDPTAWPATMDCGEIVQVIQGPLAHEPSEPRPTPPGWSGVAE
jgi:hypothetical protein